jgi:hypothetical protein
MSHFGGRPNDPIPRAARLERIEFAYGPLAEFIPCGLPHCKQLHGRGFVVTFVDENGAVGRGVIGQDCGRRHFGEAWKEEYRQHRARQRESEMHARSTEFVRLTDAVEPALEKLLPALEKQEHIRSTLYRCAPFFMRHCETAVKSGGVVRVIGPDLQVFEHNIKGGGFFVAGGDHDRAWQAVMAIRGVRHLIADPATKLKDLSERISHAGDLRQALKSARAALAEGQMALKAGHMRDLIAVVGAQMQFGETYIRVNGSVLEAAPPGSMKPIAVGNLVEFGRLAKQCLQQEATGRS